MRNERRAHGGAFVGEVPCGIVEILIEINAAFEFRDGGNAGKRGDHFFVCRNVLFVNVPCAGILHSREGEEDLSALFGDIGEKLGQGFLCGKVVTEIIFVDIIFGYTGGEIVAVFGHVGRKAIEALEACACELCAVRGEGGEEIIVVGKIEILSKAVVRFAEIPESAGAVGGAERPCSGLGAPKNDITLGDEFLDHVEVHKGSDIGIFAEVDDLVFAFESGIDDGAIVAVERAGAADDDDLFLILCPHQAVKFCRAAGVPIGGHGVNGVDIKSSRAIVKAAVRHLCHGRIEEYECFQSGAVIEGVCRNGFDGLGNDDLLYGCVVKEGVGGDGNDGLIFDLFGDGDGFGSAVIARNGNAAVGGRVGELIGGSIFFPYAPEVKRALAVGVDSRAEGDVLTGAVLFGIVADECVSVSCEGAVLMQCCGIEIEDCGGGFRSVEAVPEFTAVCVIGQREGAVYEESHFFTCGEGICCLRGDGRFAVRDRIGFGITVEGIAVFGRYGDGDGFLGADALFRFVGNVDGVCVVAQSYVFADLNAFKIVGGGGKLGVNRHGIFRRQGLVRYAGGGR